MTGLPGFSRNPINQTGHMRDDGLRGHGWFGASRGGGTRPHNGNDIRADLNQTAIVAFQAGTIIAMGPRGAMGNRIIIDHGNGLTSHYGHLEPGSIGVPAFLAEDRLCNKDSASVPRAILAM